MSYEHGTTHYNLPQTEDSDTRDWFDTNEAFRVIDEAVYSANQTAAQATQDIETVKTDISDLKDADTAMTGRVDGIESRVAANELKIDRLETDVTDGVQDLKDSICAIEETSATAAYPHLTGEFFWYNDTLYKATANIAIGQQIVPNTNCRTTNITTELLAGGGGGGAEIDDSVVSASKVWSSYKTSEEITNASAPKTGDTRWYSGKLQYYDGSAWQNTEIGGNGMLLDTANVVSLIGTATYTAPKDGELKVAITNGSTGDIQIDGHSIFTTATADTSSVGIINISYPLAAGAVITNTVETSNSKARIIKFYPYL